MKGLILGSLFPIFVSYSVWAQDSGAVPGEFIVKYKSSSVSISKVRSKLSAKADLRKAFPAMGMYHVSMKVGPGQAANLREIENDPEVEYVEPNYVWSKGQDVAQGASTGVYTRAELLGYHYVTNDPAIFAQNHSAVSAANSWARQTTLAANPKIVTVAVVDTGLDNHHNLFKPVASGGAGALWINTREANGVAGVDDDQNGFVDDINGWNFIANTNNYLDDDDHGTHVAGIIVGAGFNIFQDVLPQSKIQIMPLKFLGAGGTGTTSAAINAIYYAVNNGAQVINNSWGGPNYSRALHEALTYAYDHQVLIVTAAGNYSSNNDTKDIYPANYDVPSNVSVASASDYNTLSSFSNYGSSTVHIASPGESVVSSLPGGDAYGYMNGTSMAAPFVAGVAALALREDSNLTGYQLKQMLLSQSNQYAALNTLVSSSSRINADKMILAAKNAIGTLAYQPDYKAEYLSDRSPASEGGAGGCGLVSTAVMGGPGKGDGPNPTGGIVAGLLLLPLMVYFALRSRDPKSRRRYDRFAMSSEIRVMVGDRELVGSMKSISQGGLSFNTDQALEKGGIITMRVQSPDGREIIEVEGQVVWSEANQAYGVQFANARQGTLAMIQQWTSALTKS